jgi:FixJ family two-component response regulator
VDFLSKPVQEKDLLRAVEQGLTRAMEANAERQQLEDVQRRLNTLTPREPEMMNLVVAGMLNNRSPSSSARWKKPSKFTAPECWKR